MAGPEGKKQYNINPPKVGYLNRTRTQRSFFYIDGLLYRIVKTDRANNIMRAWCYETGKVVDFVYSDAKRHMQQAYDTAEVCQLLNRTKKTIFDHLAAGAINTPYKIQEQKRTSNGMTFGKYKWSEDDVLAMHEHFLTVGSGRPRKDGMLSAAPRLPSRMELIAMMKQNQMVYVKDANGNFVPIFEQPDWT